MRKRQRQKEQPKRRISKGEREKRRRFIVLSVIVFVIIAALALIGYGYYDTYIEPWHQGIVKVNGTVFDMHYYVKMLRLYGAGQSSDPTQDVQLARNLVSVMQNNELVNQEAKRLGITVSQAEVEEEVKSYLSYDPTTETEEAFNQRIDAALKQSHLSRADFEKLFITPMLFQQKLQDYFGNEKYPEGLLYQHVSVQALLLGTQEQALEARGKLDGGETFDQLVSELSPSRYYLSASVQWLPRGVESAVFEGFAFAEGSENAGLSGPIRDTTYSTKGGYWLVEILGETGSGDNMTLHMQGILLDSKATADEVRDKITAGEDFAALAKEYSLHTSSQANGGDMGSLSLDDVKSQFGTENFDAILALGLNNLSQPFYQAAISKDSGYWLIKVVGKENRTLSDDNRSTLVSQTLTNWLQNAPESEENRLKDYLDSGKISWALRHV